MLINCPECGGKMSDRAVVCPHCGFRGLVSIRLLWEPVWLAADPKVEVRFDGDFVGLGSVKEGGDETIDTTPGVHEISLKIRVPLQKAVKYRFEVSELGNYRIEASYSRFSGFKKDFRFSRVD